MDKEKIKQIREKALLTQSEFAKILNISFATIQSWERTNNVVPSFRMQRKIIEFCKNNNIKIG
jgi:DNA-binding transcriptional regulator YiaG